MIYEVITHPVLSDAVKLRKQSSDSFSGNGICFQSQSSGSFGSTRCKDFISTTTEVYREQLSNIDMELWQIASTSPP